MQWQHQYALLVVAILLAIAQVTLNTIDSVDLGDVLGKVIQTAPLLFLLAFIISTTKWSRRDVTQLLFIGGFLAYMLATLALEFSSPDFMFEIGLGLYLIGHICIGIGMWRDSAVHDWVPLHAARAIPFVCYGAVISYFILTGDNMTSSLMGPVLVYVTGLVGATWRAWARIGHPFEDLSRQWFAAVGYSLFLVSDTVLAYNKFVEPLEDDSTIVMVTYYAAVILIASSQPISGFLVLLRSPLINP